MTWGLADWQACPIGGQTGLKILPRLTARFDPLTGQQVS